MIGSVVTLVVVVVAIVSDFSRPVYMLGNTLEDMCKFRCGGRVVICSKVIVTKVRRVVNGNGRTLAGDRVVI